MPQTISRGELIAWGFVLSVVLFPRKFWHITGLLLGVVSRIIWLTSRTIWLALTLVAKILKFFAVVLGRSIKRVFTYPRYALASAIVAHLLVRIVGQPRPKKKVSFLRTHRASMGYGAISGGLGALFLLAVWRKRRRRAEEHARAEESRRAAEREDERRQEWEQAEHRRRTEAKRAKAEKEETQQRAKRAEAERKAKRVAAAWAAYLRRWEEIDREKGPLTFGTVPWPVLSTPRSTADLTLDVIAAFLLSPVHSEDKSGKDRIRQAQLRWHPDRFGRFLKRVKKWDRVRVENGVGYVARCLNDLREKENA